MKCSRKFILFNVHTVHLFAMLDGEVGCHGEAGRPPLGLRLTAQQLLQQVQRLGPGLMSPLCEEDVVRSLDAGATVDVFAV